MLAEAQGTGDASDCVLTAANSMQYALSYTAHSATLAKRSGRHRSVLTQRQMRLFHFLVVCLQDDYEDVKAAENALLQSIQGNR